MQNTINIVIKELWQCKMNQRDYLVLVIFVQDLLVPGVMPSWNVITFSISEKMFVTCGCLADVSVCAITG